MPPPQPSNVPAAVRPAEFSPRNPHRPFCCNRCKTADLGAWADGSYRVPAEEEPFAAPPLPH
ncbi:DNA gyrase inhibitor YacG [Kingella potus]|uniref:DNA gyrase inhibitor YacG n=1 Tax=Kingella potus TaxID=265175 RepID=UPI0031404902